MVLIQDQLLARGSKMLQTQSFETNTIFGNQPAFLVSYCIFILETYGFNLSCFFIFCLQIAAIHSKELSACLPNGQPHLAISKQCLGRDPVSFGRDLRRNLGWHASPYTTECCPRSCQRGRLEFPKKGEGNEMTSRRFARDVFFFEMT